MGGRSSRRCVELLAMLAIVVCTAAVSPWSAYLSARQGGAGGGATPVGGQTDEWAWDLTAPLEYDKSYAGVLVVTNQCDGVERVTFTVPKGAALAIQPAADVPPGKMDIKAALTTPPRPTPPDNLVVPPGADPAHLFCTYIKDELVIAYSGRGTPEAGCRPAARKMLVTAHVHYVAPAPPPPPKMRIATADECTVLWNTGLRPAGDPGIDERCAPRIRELAAAFRTRVLETLRRLDPAAWAWLPSVDEIKTMSTAELLAFKARAAGQMGIT